MLRWAKAQGAVTGYAHSASGLEIDPKAAAERLLAALDKDADGVAHAGRGRRGLAARATSRRSTPTGDGVLTRAELEAGHERAAETLPNLAIPEMNGVGAMEICVTGRRGRLRLHQRHGHAPGSPEWNMLVSPAELRLPAEGQRRDRLPLHERHAASARGGSTSSSARSTRSTSTPGARASPRAGPTSPTATPTRLEFTVGGKSPGDRLELERPATVAGPGEGRVRRPDAARRWPTAASCRPGAGGSSATR